MDKLNAMQVFVQIAERGSLTAAAKVLNSSLPAVVRTLAALEGELGIRLFNRTTRRIALTEEGKRYLGSCKQILGAIAEAALTADTAAPSGNLTITAPVLFGQMYVAPCVTRFVQRFPELRCSVVLRDHITNLLEEGIDVGIRIGTLEDSSLVAQSLGKIRRVVVASPAFLRKHGVPKHPRDLLRANCVRFTGSDSNWWSFREHDRDFNVPVSGNLDFNLATAAIDACIAGMGLGTFISYQVAPAVAKKQLKIVLEKFELPPRPINIVYPHARLLPARTRLFIEWIKQELRF